MSFLWFEVCISFSWNEITTILKPTGAYINNAFKITTFSANGETDINHYCLNLKDSTCTYYLCRFVLFLPRPS